LRRKRKRKKERREAGFGAIATGKITCSLSKEMIQNAILFSFRIPFGFDCCCLLSSR
jgi:hypothetical protein